MTRLLSDAKVLVALCDVPVVCQWRERERERERERGREGERGKRSQFDSKDYVR